MEKREYFVLLLLAATILFPGIASSYIVTTWGESYWNSYGDDYLLVRQDGFVHREGFYDTRESWGYFSIAADGAEVERIDAKITGDYFGSISHTGSTCNVYTSFGVGFMLFGGGESYDWYRTYVVRSDHSFGFSGESFNTEVELKADTEYFWVAYVGNIEKNFGLFYDDPADYGLKTHLFSAAANLSVEDIESVEPVPEPATLLLVCSGISGIIACKRRKGR